MADATLLLNAMCAGDPNAAGELIPLIYEELRKLARANLARESAGNTILATDLVHEAYIRLIGAADRRAWQNRAHFFGAAAEAMRRILIESARRKRTLKRGGNAVRQGAAADHIAAPEPDDELLAVNESLDRLAQKDAAKAELVKLRYFAGMTLVEAADVLGISRSTADAWWRFTRAWLHRDLYPNSGASP